MKTKQFFAKSNGLLLKEHSFKTAEIAKDLLKHNPELADIAPMWAVENLTVKGESFEAVYCPCVGVEKSGNYIQCYQSLPQL